LEIIIEQFFGTISMTPDLADDIVKALREKISSKVTKNPTSNSRRKILVNNRDPYEMQSHHENMTASSNIHSVPSMSNNSSFNAMSNDCMTVDMMISSQSSNGQDNHTHYKKRKNATANNNTKGNDNSMDDMLPNIDEDLPLSEVVSTKPKQIRKRKSLVEDQVHPELNTDKQAIVAKKLQAKSKKLSKSNSQDPDQSMDSDIRCDIFSQSTSEKGGKSQRKKNASVAKNCHPSETSGLTPSMSYINIKPTPDRRNRLQQSPLIGFTPLLEDRIINPRTGMTPYDHPFSEWTDHTTGGGDMEFSPGVFASPLENFMNGSITRSRRTAGGAANLSNLTGDKNDQQFRITNIDASPRTLRTISNFNRIVFEADHSKENENVNISMPPPTTTTSKRRNHRRRCNSYDGEGEEDRHYEYHRSSTTSSSQYYTRHHKHRHQQQDVDDSLEISQIDANPDYVNSPESMMEDSEGNDGNILLISPDERLDSLMGETPLLKSLFSTEEKEQPRTVSKRKYQIDDDAMTGSRLISTLHQETPSRLYSHDMYEIINLSQIYFILFY
jgi:hypothetical protein